MLFDNLGWLNYPKSIVQYITMPIQYGLYKTSRSFFKQFEFIFFAKQAVNENRAIKEQFANVLSENAQLRKELAETKGFLDQQKSLNSKNFKTVPVKPIGFSRYLIIDKGSNDGLQVGQPLVYKDNYIGKINEVSAKKSTVILPSDPDSHIAAFTSGKTGKAKGVLVGQFGSELILDKILHEEVVNKGDLVYTEGTEEEIPRGLVIGQVTQVLEKQNEVFKQSVVKQIFESTDLEILFVITN